MRCLAPKSGQKSAMTPSVRTQVTWRASSFGHSACRNPPNPSSLYGTKNERPASPPVEIGVEHYCSSGPTSFIGLSARATRRFCSICTGGYIMAFTCRRSFESLALLASSSRLRAPKTSRALTTLPGARSKPSEGRQHAPSVAPISEHLEKYSESTHTDDHSSAPHQQTFSSPPSEGERLLLESFELFRRVILLCERGDVDLAITALQEAPLDAQNIKVWNRIIKGCMEAKKYNLAYSVFTDVRP